MEEVCQHTWNKILEADDTSQWVLQEMWRKSVQRWLCGISLHKGLYSQIYGFSSSQVWMLESDHKGGRALKNWCFWTVVLEKTLYSLLDCKDIKPVHSEGNQLWIFIGRTHTEAQAPIHWPPAGKSQLIGKNPDAGKDWAQEEKGTTEDEMVGWHHRLNGHEFEQPLGDGEGQRSLVCCSSSGCKESDMS